MDSYKISSSGKGAFDLDFGERVDDRRQDMSPSKHLLTNAHKVGYCVFAISNELHFCLVQVITWSYSWCQPLANYSQSTPRVVSDNTFKVRVDLQRLQHGSASHLLRGDVEQESQVGILQVCRALSCQQTPNTCSFGAAESYLLGLELHFVSIWARIDFVAEVVSVQWRLQRDLYS